MTDKEIRAQIDTENVKGLLLINGGGAVALLAFLPTILNKAGYESFVKAILFGLLCFSGGLIVALIHNHLRRRCSLVYSADRPRYKFLAIGLPEPWVCHWSHLFMYTSYALFIIAVISISLGGYKVINTADQNVKEKTVTKISTYTDKDANIKE